MEGSAWCASLQVKRLKWLCIQFVKLSNFMNKNKEYFLWMFGRDMLFSKLDTFYGPAASYIQFPNTHISILEETRAKASFMYFEF